jgi:hypothetical protein
LRIRFAKSIADLPTDRARFTPTVHGPQPHPEPTTLRQQDGSIPKPVDDADQPRKV